MAERVGQQRVVATRPRILDRLRRPFKGTYLVSGLEEQIRKRAG